MQSDCDWCGRQYDLVILCGIIMRLYHNPRCSKSRQALKLMKESGVEFEEYRYLDNGIHTDDLLILSRLDDVIRINDLSTADGTDLSDETQIIEILKNNPRVLQRPVLISGQQAVIGRPPEEILILLLEA